MNEEQYDVLDQYGKKTGQVLSKSEVHERELWHASVFVWIYNNKDEVLLQLRGKDKRSFPGVWDVSVAGHISAGDTPTSTAVREVKEEIGLTIKSEELEFIEYTMDIVPLLPNKKHPEYCWVYLLNKEVYLEELIIEEGELTEVKLMPIEQLLKELEDPIKSKTYAARQPKVFKEPLEKILEL